MRISLAFVPRRPSLCSLLQFVPLILAQPPPPSPPRANSIRQKGERRQASPINSRTYAICALHARSNFCAATACLRTRAYRFEFFPSFLAHTAICCFNYLLRHLSQYSKVNKMSFISCVSLTLTIPQFLHCRLASSCEHWMTTSHSTSLLSFAKDDGEEITGSWKSFSRLPTGTDRHSFAPDSQHFFAFPNSLRSL